MCPVGQASILGLYDDDRARGPRLRGNATTWEQLDRALAEALATADAGARAVRVIVPWGLGPTTEEAVDQLLARHKTAAVVRFDPLGWRDAMATAHEALYGVRVVPDFRLDGADRRRARAGPRPSAGARAARVEPLADGRRFR